MPDHKLIEMKSSFDMDQLRKLYVHQWFYHDLKFTAASDQDLPRVDMNIKDCEGDTRHGWSNRPLTLEGAIARNIKPWLTQN